jgi:hypothetical protein
MSGAWEALHSLTGPQICSRFNHRHPSEQSGKQIASEVEMWTWMVGAERSLVWPAEGLGRGRPLLLGQGYGAISCHGLGCYRGHGEQVAGVLT